MKSGTEMTQTELSAEIPDPMDPVLHDLVKKKIMFQVPCTIDNPTAPCMENDSCQRKFQKKRY